MHKMCSDERKCAVMKGCLFSDEVRKNKGVCSIYCYESRMQGVETGKQDVGVYIRGIKCKNNRK